MAARVILSVTGAAFVAGGSTLLYRSVRAASANPPKDMEVNGPPGEVDAWEEMRAWRASRDRVPYIPRRRMPDA